MSRTAKITLATSIVASVTIVWGVHYLQVKEKESMHANIAREETRELKRLHEENNNIDNKAEKFKQNIRELEQQIQLQEEYEKVQPVNRHVDR
ncbi:9603_t:CDS:2 [Ambispora leptoticha]|uniref:9603_t:CDS:1 n=1 Tax=Ambispora leptoticha TaxID=144679 RepID=A0A9N9FUR8_9GLOM|nr:9603_t:CDS:2 [Ambispora leptoticha]